MNNYFLLFFSMLIDILILSIYFNKKRVSLFENRIYISLIITNLICLILEILCNICASGFYNEYKGIIVRIFFVIQNS